MPPGRRPCRLSPTTRNFRSCTVQPSFRSRPEERDLAHQVRLLGGSDFGRGHEALELADFPQAVHLGRYEAGVLEYPIGDAQVLRDVGVIVELERLALPREVVELAPGDRLGDFLLCNLVEHCVSLALVTRGGPVASWIEAAGAKFRLGFDRDAVRVAGELVPVAPAVERMAAARELIDGLLRVARLDVQRVARLAEREAAGK